MRRGLSASQGRMLGIVVVAVTFAALAWHRRWMSDDGMIFVRTVRQLIAGNGPTFNTFERAESGTSTLWTYLLAAIAWPSGRNVSYIAVYLGWLLSVAGVVLGMIAAARLHRERGERIVPVGVIVVLAVFPFWDFATSGLETGLGFAWLALCWWLLVTVDARRLLVAAIVFGLGPLVRPDFALVSMVMAAAAWLIERPSWRRTLVLAGAALALPVAYEIFRAGYYGTLVPLPALAKSATHAQWSRGLRYLRDFNHPYALWIPLAVIAASLGYLLRTAPPARRDRITLAAPVIAGVLMALYVLRVGGDFMHARMLLPPLFLLLLPAFMLPLRRTTAPACVVLAVWGCWIVATTADGESHASIPPIEDERVGYSHWTGREHPIHEKHFIHADHLAAEKIAAALRDGKRMVIWGAAPLDFPLAPAIDAPIGVMAGRLGTSGAMAPLDVPVIDMLGLSNPLGARITPTLLGLPGHEKPLPPAWILADYGAADAAEAGITPVAVAAARRALQCGELKELLESVRAPMTASRFWANLTGAIRRTRLEIPADPIEAEWKFCTNPQVPLVTASTSYEAEGWSLPALIDGVTTSTPSSRGWSAVQDPARTLQWVALEFLAPRHISKVTLYPAEDAFPIDFTIQVWDGTRWIDRVTQRGVAFPSGPQTYTWAPGDVTMRVRVLATRLLLSHGLYSMELAEIEAGD